MAILRFQPGDPAPRAGKYSLVDHFGEKLNVDVWCDEGSRLPLVAVAGYSPIWFVQTSEATTAAEAA